jgi:UPF0755 protein
MKKLILILVFIAAIAMSGYVMYREGILPVDAKDTSTRQIVIRRGEKLDSIINTLAVQKLIRSRVVFYFVVKRLGIERQIQAGTYDLSASMDAYAIATALTKGTNDVWITIPEGLRKEEVAEIVARNLLEVSVAEFINKAEEGYLFPDTYLFPKAATTESVINVMRKTFNKKVTPEMKSRAAKLGLTEHELITLASLVEREAQKAADRQPMASVALRRLRDGMPLQIDASVQYALGYQKEQKSWWKRPLYYVDLEVDSAYNTYKYPGIPPGPIANPGIAAIEAVLNADPTTKYLYYVNDENGKLHFAQTYAQHLENVEKYVRRKR